MSHREELIQTAAALLHERGYEATGVDTICAKAKANKGSFYHHFSSKKDLTLATIEWNWTHFKEMLDMSFANDVPARQRFTRFFKASLAHQSTAYAATGKVLGCPLFNLGSELANLEGQLRAKVDEVLGKTAAYYINTLNAMKEEGGLHPDCDTVALGWQILTYSEGAMTLGRIQNSLTAIEAIEPTVMALINAKRL